MRNRFLSQVLLASCLAAPVTGFAQEAEDGLIVKPLSMTTQVDAGKIVSGNYNGGRLDDQFIQRTSVWITQEIGIGPRLDVRAGVGGLFWYATPTPVANGVFSEVAPFSTTTKFGPGITRADMEYRFGDLQEPMFTLQVGYFPYKYNPDAKNLGEYLLRSGAYPGYMVTGGWNLISGAGYMMQGARLNMSLLKGKLQTEFLLPMEQDLPGVNGDLSPTIIVSGTPVRGLSLSAGANCHHCVAVRPSETSPKIRKPADGTFFGLGNGYVIENPAFDTSVASTDINGNNPRYTLDTSNFYTFQGLKLMARASIDPKAYLPVSAAGLFNPEDLKIFGEVAVLGWKNYTYYYEKRSERTPVMFGMNLPTRVLGYSLLDVLSVQFQHYTSRNPDAVIYSSSSLPLPTSWGYDANGNVTLDPNLIERDHQKVKGDDWKWSVYARKEVVKGLRIYTQVANDHMRLPNEWGANPSIPLTNASDDWYYLVRFELGI